MNKENPIYRICRTNKTTEVINPTKMTKEQQVKELEEDYNKLPKDGIDRMMFLKLIKQKAKLLKSEIEKGCGEITDGNNEFGTMNCGDVWGHNEADEWIYDNKKFCLNCQNLIDRLNKIIGDEEWKKE